MWWRPCSRPTRSSLSLLGLIFLHELPRWTASFWARVLIVAGAIGLSLDKHLHLASFKPRLVLLMLAATFVLALSSVVFKFFAVHDEFWSTTFWTFVGEGLFGAAILAVPNYRRQFVTLFRKNPGAVIGVNAANELINLGGGLGVRYASLLAPVALVSAISATTTFFVFLFGILLTLFFPRFGTGGFVGAKRLPEGGRRSSDHGGRGADRGFWCRTLILRRFHAPLSAQ